MKNDKDGSLDLADIKFERRPRGWVPEIVEVDGNAHDKDVDANG